MNKIKPTAWILMVALFPAAAAIAQQQDTLSNIRTFISVCNVYKELPLQLEVQLRHSTNYVTSPDDTMNVRVKFFLQQEGSYVSFASSILPERKGLAGIELKSRLAIPYTKTPKELIRVNYRTAGNQPSEIIQTSRRLAPITEQEYATLSAKPEWAGYLVAAPDKSHFLIKEQVATYVYDKISHTTGLKLPVAVSDRVAPDSYGRYGPVKAFGDFSLTQNF